MHEKGGVTPHGATEKDPGEQEGGHVEVHHNGDGTYMTVHQPSGEEKEHPTLHHALHAVAEHHGGSDHDVHEHPPEHGEPDGDEAGADEY